MDCPDIAELEHFASATLDNDRQSSLSAHLSTCSDCRKRLEDLHDNDAVEREIRNLFATEARVWKDAPGRLIAGRFRLIREIGRGGMGVVFEAEQDRPRRRVALKLLAGAGADGRALERLLGREVRALARLERRSIAAIYDAGLTDDGRAYFAMEFVEGLAFIHYANRADLGLVDRLRLFAEVCDAVAYAHQCGVIHRDLKPGNILVTVDGTPKVLDFGLARVVDLDDSEPARSLETEPGRILGTLPYMSPEHARGRPHEVDVRSDVYSLGVILYELLTDRLPNEIPRNDIARALRMIIEQPPASMRTAARRIPLDVQTIVLKTLEKDPERRYASVSELAADIRRFLAREPIAARPTTVWYHLTRFADRNRTLVAAVTLAFLAVLAGAGVAVTQARAAMFERDAATRRMEYAQDSANYVFAGVGSQITGVLGTGDIQRHLSEAAYVFYRKLADEDPGDVSAQIWLCMSLRRLAQQSLDVGNLERAALLADLARDRAERTQHENAGDPRLDSELIFGALLAARIAGESGDRAAVAGHAQAAMVHRDRALAGYRAQGVARGESSRDVPQSGPEGGRTPPLIAAAAGWAQTVSEMIDTFLVADARFAAAQFEEALAVLDEMEAIDPCLDDIYLIDLSEHAPLSPPVLLRRGARPIYERSRASLLRGRALAALNAGQLSEAREACRHALETADRLADSLGDHPAIILIQAQCHDAAARILSALGDAAAENHRTTALANLQRLVESDPKNCSWARALEELSRAGR